MTAHPPRPSFGFARRNGATLVAWRGDEAEVAWREGVKPDVLSELQRHLRAPLKLVRYDASGYERLLRELYEQGDDARAVVAGFDDASGDALDLKTLADELPEPEDLLESEDDAPIIRLINALLTEAVKEGASDIHI
ncbi:MAG: type II secretion system protein GspE, partial [Rudaea sp.]